MDGLMERLTFEAFASVLQTRRWCKETGLSQSKQNRDVLFTKKRNIEKFRAPLMYGKPLTLVEEVKYLGLSGAGLCLEGRDVEQSFALGSYATVFQAEVFAILMTAHKEEVRNCPEQKIVICSDSKAALQAICAPRTKSALAQECGDALKQLASQKEVTLVWVPGHTSRRFIHSCPPEVGVVSNRRVRFNTSAIYDFFLLRREQSGSREPCQGPEPFLGISRRYANKALDSWAYKTLENNWRRDGGCRQAHDLIARPSKTATAWLLGRSRRTLNLLVGILTGHCRLNRHLSLMGIEQNPICPKCEMEEETSLHFLGQCTALGRLRHDVFGASELRREEVGSLRWTDILIFIKRSGRFAQDQGRVGGG
ncbi:hypothetical protein NQ317_018863 [Molorchus minor]|uniref:Uncharacterized protein n=1 Tax=Molorchus minor TaxID=1323400 RepID=A0ABQ9IXZ2_9CUCU|nr:hypothetical protein NQ317_018863 [Molorchus minor]